jgi:N-acylneuraminate cytidylyltransferase
MNIAIIPARKNSKRIKNKNIKLFKGKPIIYWTIKYLKESKLFKEIFVSTDSKKIANLSEKYGVKALYPRPKLLSNDTTGILKVMSYEVKKLIKRDNNFNNVCCVFPASPLLKKFYLIKGLSLLNKDTDFVFSVSKNEKSTLRSFYLNNNYLQMINEKFLNFRTQDLPESFMDAGQFYWAEKKKWIKKKKIFSKRSKIVVLPKNLTVDIDTIQDWKRAVKLCK